MIGWQFSQYLPEDGDSIFDRLYKVFKDLLIHTSGDVSEAIKWMTELDKQYHLTTPEYGIGDFVEDLLKMGLIKPSTGNQKFESFEPTSKMEIALRKQALDDIFDQLKKSKLGNHNTKFGGNGDEITSEIRPYLFGDKMDDLAVTESIRNAQINHGIDEFQLTEEDLQINETYLKAQTSTVLMIDISHSMILYGEDRITPAKKVALALSELILTKYPKDSLDIIVFGDDAWRIEIKDLPYLTVGPYHTNTVAGLELAMDILRKKKATNKQIMMITDGKPTCLKKGQNYYKNSFGLDRKIVSRTLALAAMCRKVNIPITTFMIARDPYLVRFIDQFTKANQGKAFYSSLSALGEFVFMDYKQNKRKKRN